MDKFEIATLGAGCFWCVEAVYEALEGVQSVKSGYMGGTLANPSYEDVCSGKTGHIEVARIKFDPGKVSYEEILEVFFAVHDPTSLDRQGADIGIQYRSVIFYHSEAQQAAAEKMIAALNAKGEFDKPIVTELRPAVEFYAAEDYHQQYFNRNPKQPYCTIVVAPKMAKFRSTFPGRLKQPGT